VERAVTDAAAVLAGLKPQAPLIDEITRAIAKALNAGHKLLICGNGGSACEAQHFAAELVGRYRAARPGLPALALAVDGALMSCLGNDFNFADIFARQVQALGQPGDVLVALSTSGNSENVLRAVTCARQTGLLSIALLGKDGGRMKGGADLELIVAHGDTARVQEAHQFLIHAIMDGVEDSLGAQKAGVTSM
jgi:D-sedoheptulose 7-phosphate isomerase